MLRLADHGLYVAKQEGRNQAVGLLPNTNAPAIGSHTGIDKYCRLEQLLEDDLIREVRTPGDSALAAAASQ